VYVLIYSPIEQNYRSVNQRRSCLECRVCDVLVLALTKCKRLRRLQYLMNKTRKKIL